MDQYPPTAPHHCTAERSTAARLTAFLTAYAAARGGGFRPPNPPPGEPGHDHWGGPRPAGLDRALWWAYGDRFPGSFCRWLTNTAEGRAVLAERRGGVAS